MGLLSRTDISWRVVGIVALALVLTTSLAVGVLSAGVVAEEEADTDTDTETACETVVVHDAYMTDEQAIEAVANGSTVRSTEQNTQVVLGESNTFYTIEGTNPNTYCVHFVVKVSSDAMTPAQLPAEIQSDDGDHEASWDAMHNFSSGETHTQIEFTLPADTTARWSPHEMRIESIAWASTSRRKATGMFDQLRQRFTGEDEVVKRKYDITANASGEQVTIPLENPETGESIDNWRARYTLNDGFSWHTLGTSAEDPVFYTEAQDGSSIRVTFQNPDARVKFIANPTRKDEITEEWTMWESGLKEIGSRMPWN